MEFIVIGLGNPGKEYENSRHNVGYKTIDILCDRYGVKLSKETSSSQGASIVLGGHKTLIAKSNTFMNDSGVAVGEIIRRYKVGPKNLIVVHDELDLEDGIVKIKLGGGLAGHNGLRSIKQHIKTQDFIRVRIGVGKPSHKTQGASHVLKALSKKEMEELLISCEMSADIVETIIETNLENAMLKFHSL
ncbi:MAG: aminoacyl-tRNA hydrolase [Acidimicrobiia bacterium]